MSGTYEVYVDVRHHPRHLDDWEKRESTAFKLVDTGDKISMVANALRAFADELEAKPVEHERDPERKTYWINLGGKRVEVVPVDAATNEKEGRPPCQGYSKAQRIRGNDHPQLIEPLRELLEQTGLPYVIEVTS